MPGQAIIWLLGPACGVVLADQSMKFLAAQSDLSFMLRRTQHDGVTMTHRTLVSMAGIVALLAEWLAGGAVPAAMLSAALGASASNLIDKRRNGGVANCFAAGGLTFNIADLVIVLLVPLVVVKTLL